MARKPARSKEIRALQEKFGIYEHSIPEALGTDLQHWIEFQRVIGRAARDEHDRKCSSFDGRRRLAPLDRFAGDHGDNHEAAVRQVLAALLNAGLRIDVTPSNIPELGGSHEES